jgi:diacylglycerol O-acyltransferase 2, plant
MAAGFVRIAIEQQAALVPIVVLGEVDCLRNFVDAPRLQAWSYKKLGFPVSTQWIVLQ